MDKWTVVEKQIYFATSVGKLKKIINFFLVQQEVANLINYETILIMRKKYILVTLSEGI